MIKLRNNLIKNSIVLADYIFWKAMILLHGIFALRLILILKLLVVVKFMMKEITFN